MSVRTLAKSPVGGTQMATGIYTGDGAATQAIVGVGFQPKFVMIYPRFQLSNIGAWGLKNDGHGTRTTLYAQPSGSFKWQTDEVISLDADGFTVGDGTALGFNHFNTNARDYTYICFR